MIPTEYKPFFGAITKAFITKPDFYKYFIRQGFDPAQWPECDARDIAISFHNIAQKKSVEYAQLKYFKNAEGLGDHRLPTDANSVICAFSEFKEFGLFLELGQKLLRDPKDGNAIISGFKNRTISGVVVKSLKEEIQAHIEKRVREGADKVETEILIDGWPLVSRLIGGFNPGRVNLIVAGTGVGKTTLALNLIIASMKTMPTLYFNMEMPLSDIYDRICMIGSGLTSREWRHMSDQRSIQNAANFITQVYGLNDLFITDGKALTIEQITSEIFSHQEKNKVQLVFVDYDQKIRTRYAGEEWQTLQRAIEELEETAKTTNTCIVVLAQGDENNLPKASKRSMQSASAILALYRDDSGDYFIETKKNRFGRNNVQIQVQTDFERYKISELHEAIPSKPGIYKPNVARKN